jgi:hypothetical protein
MAGAGRETRHAFLFERLTRLLRPARPNIIAVCSTVLALTMFRRLANIYADVNEHGFNAR